MILEGLMWVTDTLGIRRTIERVGRSISLQNADGEEMTPTEESQSEPDPQPDPTPPEAPQRSMHGSLTSR